MAKDTIPISPGTGTGTVDVAVDTLADGSKIQRMKVSFGDDGNASDVSSATPLPVTSPTDFPDANALAKLEAIRLLLDGTLDVNVLQLPNGLSTEATLQALVAAVTAQAKAADVQPVALTDDSLVERLVLKALAKLTFSTSGLRVDGSGATLTVNIAASQTLATVSQVAACSQVAMGRATVDGQGIQLSQMAFQQSVRRNLSVS